MNSEQKQYIEQNRDLIKNNDWDEFFLDAPKGTGAVLYIAGIDFMQEMEQVPDECFVESCLTNITIPEGVKSIGEYAFYKCSSLTSITIPDSVISIGKSAFCDCSDLTSINIPNSVTHIGSNAFWRCSSLASITIPDSVITIRSWAFYNCSSLTSITIPSSVTTIDNRAFWKCTSLETVNFTGTSEQWRKIKIGEEVFTNVPARKVICSDGITNLRT